MKQTAVEWIEKIRHGQKGQPFDDYEWDIAFNHAKKMEKEQIIDFGYDIAEDLAWGKYRDKKAMEERYNEFLTYREEDDDI
jgi:hypothetical protein